MLQRRAGQSDFEPAYMGADAPTIQSESGAFRTGPAPDFVPEDNVTFAYPVNKQTNFFRNESNQGYVQLAQGQDYLFTGAPGNGPDPTKVAAENPLLALRRFNTRVGDQLRLTQRPTASSLPLPAARCSPPK